ncbi:MAG TPA: DinB family protein [Ktedonobacterales bacterium]|nr:DinB family protein [Ktedonobacterales bacterium]
MPDRSSGSSDASAPTREELIFLLTRGNAHMGFEEAVADFPEAAMNTPFPNGTYTPWHLLEHIRLTQWDILDFVRNPAYQERNWPDDYWPSTDKQATREDWFKTIRLFLADRQALKELVADPATDLNATIPHGSGQTVTREILVVADHNAYHTGEFAIMRQVMGTWGKGHP